MFNFESNYQSRAETRLDIKKKRVTLLSLGLSGLPQGLSFLSQFSHVFWLVGRRLQGLFFLFDFSLLLGAHLDASE